MLSQYRAK